MNMNEYRLLLAESASLRSMLERLPPSSLIERKSLEARLKHVEEQISSAKTTREPVRARLTFRGKPIVGTHGIFAEFGAKVINAFADAVAKIGASQTTELGARGVVPGRNDYQLLITGTALGSFGFELEEAPKDDMLLPELSLVEPALEQAEAIIRASVATDDELTEAISEVDPRALEALRIFLKTMADQDAVCAIEFKDKVFRFDDVGQLRRSECRLSQDNIHEDDQNIEGRFLGVLPHRRTFEFEIAEGHEIIIGKVGPEIRDAGEINHVIGQSLTVKVHTKKAGMGRPKFMLLEYNRLATE